LPAFQHADPDRAGSHAVARLFYLHHHPRFFSRSDNILLSHPRRNLLSNLSRLATPTAVNPLRKRPLVFRLSARPHQVQKSGQPETLPRLNRYLTWLHRLLHRFEAIRRMAAFVVTQPGIDATRYEPAVAFSRDHSDFAHEWTPLRNHPAALNAVNLMVLAPPILPVGSPNGRERTDEIPGIEFCSRQATSVRQVGTSVRMPYTQTKTETNCFAFRYFPEDSRNRNKGVSATEATHERAASLSSRTAAKPLLAEAPVASENVVEEHELLTPDPASGRVPVDATDTSESSAILQSCLW
jgi:hypothetical protein